MEIFQELFLTVIISLSLAFLIAKLVSLTSNGNLEEEEIVLRSDKKFEKKVKEFNRGVIVKEEEEKEKSFVGEFKNSGLEIEEKFEFVEEPLIVEEIERDLVSERSSSIVHGGGGGGEVLKEDSEFEHKEKEEEEEEQVNVIVSEEKSIKESHSDKAAVAAEAETSVSAGDGGGEINMFVKMPERVEVHKIGLELANEEQNTHQYEQIQVIDHENNHEIEIQAEKSGSECLFSDEDDWEGVERTEIENLFNLASRFVSSDENSELLSKFSSDVHMQLYGLHKVAMEGPCREPQPLALMVSSRANWHAWQRLGNMSPDVAMEKYIALLSDNIPGWVTGDSKEVSEDIKHKDSPQDALQLKDQNLSSHLHGQPISKDDSKLGDLSKG